MSRTIVRVWILDLILLSCPWAVDAAKDDWLTRLNAWSCKVTGFGCERNAVEFAKYRGAGSSRPLGGSLTVFDRVTLKTRVLWNNCHCWSPVPLGTGELAVLTETGITRVPVEKPEQRATVAPRELAEELLGVEFFADRSLVLLRASRNSNKTGCELELARLRRQDFREEPLPPETADLVCGTGVDFATLLRPAQVSGQQTLETLRYRKRYLIAMESGGDTQPVFPSTPVRNTQQFDPVWLDKDRIVFIEAP